MMFANTAKDPSLNAFVTWLVRLRDPLPQDLQTPTALALQYAGGDAQTQVRISNAFKQAVKEDPSYSQCKPEDTKIISELVASMGSLFYTLAEFNDFLSQQRVEVEVVTRKGKAEQGLSSE